ncbi:MAG TPA: cupredoxin domain-containing protein [Actinomycetota bacterium]|nr:cupredoxin domain-containing protein [Actinomycetota bacterium]
MGPKVVRTSAASRTGGLPMWLTALGAAVAMLLAACGPGAARASGQRSSPAAPAGSTTTTGTTAITIVNFKFAPTPVTVKAGTAVEWTNRDGVAHAVDFSVPDLHSSLLNSSDHFEHTFATPGSYAYICRIHPFMHGTLVVTT